MKVVRDSKFRHVHGDAIKEKYEDLRLSTKATESTGIRGNSKFFSFAWESGGGGALAVIPLAKTGRIPRDLPLITGHSGPILDFDFNPFDENSLISASEDLTLKLWNIPDEGLKAHLKEPVATLQGHGKKVSFCLYHPTAANIVASSSLDMTVKVWDASVQEEAFNATIPDQALSMKWNYSGSLIAVTCKDKKLRIIDPRANSTASEVKIHDGSKASKVEWLGSPSSTDDCNKLVTTGFSQQAERQLGVWDIRKFSAVGGPDVEPLNMLVLDQGTGALFPFFDPGTQMLYLAGKGDGNVRYFEVTGEDPFVHYISAYSSTVPQKAFDFLPKRCVDVGSHEIMRGLKLENTAMQPLTFRVPRKSEAFQDDLFPDCPAGVPAMTGDEWLSGAETRAPVLRSMRPGDESPTGSAAPKSPTMGVLTVKDLKKQLAEAQVRIVALESENELLKAELAKLKG